MQVLVRHTFALARQCVHCEAALGDLFVLAQ